MYPLASSTWDKKEVEVATNLLNSGQLTLGREVLEFEKMFASYIGTTYAIMFNSGSSANLAMFAALKYQSSATLRDEARVIVPAVSWSTTFYPVNQMGYVLDFVDIDSDTLNLDIAEVERQIKPDTGAIFAVNLLGNPAELFKLKKIADDHNLILLEDNCESLGATLDGKRAGSFGEMSSHSFYFSHHICTMEGGMVNTNSKELMETLMSLRSHGWTRGLEDKNSVYPKSKNEWEDLFRFVLPGYNLRPTELSAAIGKIQLSKLPAFIDERRKNGAYFKSLFDDSKSFKIQKENGRSSWFGFSIILQGALTGKREEIINYLKIHKIETRPIVAGNFTRNPVMKHLKFEPLQGLKNSNLVHEDGFFIGNHHYDVTENLKLIHDLLTKFEKRYSR